jgi:hypothetical protein
MIGMFQSLFHMSETIHWPPGDFTIEEAVSLNPAFTRAVISKKLSSAMAAKTIIQTQKGNEKIKGKFQVVNPAGAPGN